MAKWEYKVFEHRGGISHDQEVLTTYGDDGWELVSVVEYDGERRFFMKRSVFMRSPRHPGEL